MEIVAAGMRLIVELAKTVVLRIQTPAFHAVGDLILLLIGGH